jgi:hypothetical protein
MSTTIIPGAPAPLLAQVALLSASGDLGAELAGLAVQCGSTQRRDAVTERNAEEVLEEESEAREIDAMREKADDIRGEAIWQGIGTMAQGAGALAAGLDRPGTGEGPGEARTVAEASRSARWEALGKCLGGGATVAGAFFAGASSTDDANAAKEKANADHAKDAASDMQDTAKAASDYVDAAMSFYRDYVSAEGQSRNAALHRA